MRYEVRAYMIDATKNDEIAQHALNDIIESVKKMQYLKFENCAAHRAELLSAARFMVRAHGGGFWVEGADLQHKDSELRWFPVQWFLFEDDAKKKMIDAHKASHKHYVYRVVSENSIVDARMTCDR